MADNFFEDRDNNSILKLRRIRAELPSLTDEFFRGIESQTTLLTRLNYAYDLRIFFHFIMNELPKFKGTYNITLEHIKQIDLTDLECYVEFLTYYTYRGNTYKCGPEAKSRKLSSLRSFFKYYYNKGALEKDVASKIAMPKLKEKEIVKLEVNEIVRLLNEVERGDTLTPKQKYYHKKTRLRDLAMMTLFLGTGIRISECVGLNIDDIDFRNNSFVVTRKGGKRQILYFSDEVGKTLNRYMIKRLSNKDVSTNEKALFLSMQNKRISVRSVQQLVKKYSEMVTPLKKITPHKLRSTYGTNLYRETGDIYVVAEVLGHRDVNTTKKHYAAMSDDIRRKASQAVKLRDIEEDVDDFDGHDE